MDKRGLKLILVIAIILIAGCRSVPRDTREPSTFDYRYGTQGLELVFPTGTLGRVFENEDIQIVIEVKNRGAFPQPESELGLGGRIWVGGIDPGIITLEPEGGNGARLDDRTLDGKSQSNREGGYTAVVLTGEVRGLPEATPYYKPKLQVTATYVYETLAAPNVCIDPNPRSTDLRQKVCNIWEYSSVPTKGSQGAPVAVTRIEEDWTGRYITFRLFIRNVGGGFVIDQREQVLTKNPYLGYSYDELNNVYIKEAMVGNSRLDCTPDVSEFVKLQNGEGFFFCKMPLAGINTVYVSQLNIKLRYGYTSSISRYIDVLPEI